MKIPIASSKAIRLSKKLSIMNCLIRFDLAARLLIGVFINHELSYDKFNVNGDRIVRVTMEYKNAETVNTTATTGTKVGPQFKRTFPAVEEYSRAFLSQGIVRYGEKVFDEQRILFCRRSIFQNIF